MAFSSFGASLTCVGKHAPPKPTTPHSFTDSLIYSLVKGSLGTSYSISSYCSSFSMIIDKTFEPFGTSLGSIFLTVPEIDEWILAETNPFALAISCPLSTLSPISITGTAGAPICWDTGITTSFPGFTFLTATSFESSFPSYGWTPPLNVRIDIFLPLSIFYSLIL